MSFSRGAAVPANAAAAARHDGWPDADAVAAEPGDVHELRDLTLTPPARAYRQPQQHYHGHHDTLAPSAPSSRPPSPTGTAPPPFVSREQSRRSSLVLAPAAAGDHHVAAGHTPPLSVPASPSIRAVGAANSQPQDVPAAAALALGAQFPPRYSQADLAMKNWGSAVNAANAANAASSSSSATPATLQQQQPNQHLWLATPPAPGSPQTPPTMPAASSHLLANASPRSGFAGLLQLPATPFFSALENSPTMGSPRMPTAGLSGAGTGAPAMFSMVDSPFYVPPAQLQRYLSAKTFLLKLGRTLFSFGMPTFTLESTLSDAAAALDVQASFGALPSSLSAYFEHPWGLSEATMVHLSFGLDMGRLYLTNQLCKDLMAGRLTLEQASAELDNILQNGSMWSTPWLLTAFALGSFGGAPLAFGGGWADALASFVLGLLVGIVNMALAPTNLANLFEFLAAMLVSFLTLAVQHWISPSVCFSATTLSGLLVPLPGLWISTSFLELSTKQIVSGACRMWWSLMIAFQLAFGLAVGYNVFYFFFPALKASGGTLMQCGAHALPPAWNALFLPLIAASLNILLNAHRAQHLPMAGAAALSYTLFYVLTAHAHLTLEATALIIAFVIGVLANAWSRVFGGGAIEVTLTGVILLVPGSVATRDSVYLVDPAATGGAFQNAGAGIALRFVVIALSISVGLLAARIVDGVDLALNTRAEKPREHRH
ncbi:hypothetical protein AMAG_01089 [Allomyces macrogynus ATCC 38327]|uniref:Threonine/serine exporter-like N-terminal domain-containing protein n=1 Tax=Allomyces macrogynus (strain ATCC 38327) TaxID=578462 RepID=A0A0L0RYD9_ALLM3|nr:hypothetical protein AMAG_01089 [Allomyces macrogynus ATCC 38327]|eukprot:KNE55170.1 hypothetical protein AMAG_01089 [Allomyces macrogynus ATCC 38327]